MAESGAPNPPAPWYSPHHLHPTHPWLPKGQTTVEVFSRFPKQLGTKTAEFQQIGKLRSTKFPGCQEWLLWGPNGLTGRTNKNPRPCSSIYCTLLLWAQISGKMQQGTILHGTLWALCGTFCTFFRTLAKCALIGWKLEHKFEHHLVFREAEK